MPSVHQWAVEMAIDAIAEDGRVVQLVKKSDGSDTGWNMTDTDSSEVVADVKAIEFEYTAKEVDGNLILATDRKYMMDSQFKPDTTMKVRDGGVDYEIRAVNPFQPGPDLIYYDVQARL